MDTLSEVLRAVRLTGAVYFTIDGTAPWVVETPPGAVIAPHIGGGVEHVINYHVITSGGLLGRAGGRAGLSDRGRRHRRVPARRPARPVERAGNARPRRAPDVYQAASRQNVPLCLSLLGGGPAGAALVCGFLGCDARPFNPLLAALPRVIHLPAAREGTAAARGLIDLALAESTAPRPGSAGVLSRLSEVLLVEMVRFSRPRRRASRPASRPGWFAGLEDASGGPALNKLHERPTTVWTLARLAKEVGTSRSVLAERFTHLVGMPPDAVPRPLAHADGGEPAAHHVRRAGGDRRARRLRLGGGAEPGVQAFAGRGARVLPTGPGGRSGRWATRPGRPVILIRTRSLYLQ